MFTGILQKLQQLANWKALVIALGVFLLCMAFLAGYIVPNIRSRHPDAVKNGVLVMVDAQPFATAEEVYQIFKLYQPDILGYVRMLYVIDFFAPVAIVSGLISIMGMLLKYFGQTAKWRWLLLLPCLPVPFDYLENLLALFLMAQYPAHVYPGLAGAEGIVTVIKLTGYQLAEIVTGGMLLVGVVKFIYTRIKGVKLGTI